MWAIVQYTPANILECKSTELKIYMRGVANTSKYI